MKFESLANELIFYIFEYFNTKHLIHAFLDLNSRFDHLLYVHLQNNPLHLQSICKKHCDIICEEYLSKLTNSIEILRLCNDDETPYLIENIFSFGLTINRFVYLKTFSLYHLNCFHTINTILIQCRSLLNLQNFSLIDCQIEDEYESVVRTIENIWKLPYLRSCIINNLIFAQKWMRKMSIVSLTLQSLSIKMIHGDFDCLLKSVPYLQYFQCDTICWPFWMQNKGPILSLHSLTASFQGPNSLTLDFLQNLPNLQSLTIEIGRILMSGYDWASFLTHYMPKLKIFHLKITFCFKNETNILARMNSLIATYRTPFWIVEHQWFVQCDCYSSINGYIYLLYTLPYVFKQCHYLNTSYSVSTKTFNDKNDGSFKRVQYVDEELFHINFIDDLKLFNRRLPNIRHFEVTFPIIGHSNLLSKLTFNQLESLTVELNNSFGYEQLQIIINRSPILYSLKLISFGNSIEKLFQLTSSSIHRLDLISAQYKTKLILTQEQYMKLITSPFGQQCQVLIILLSNRNDLHFLIEKMPHLRTIIFDLNEIYLTNYIPYSLRRKILTQWIRKNISQKCLITKDLHISLWISKEMNSLSFQNNYKSHRKYYSIWKLLFFIFIICLFLYTYFII